MPAWLASAWALLRSGRFLAGTGAGAASTALVPIPGFDIGGIFGGGGAPRRRRRRRALTAQDRADIAFVSGILGKPAAKDFAVTLIAGLSR